MHLQGRLPCRESTHHDPVGPSEVDRQAVDAGLPKALNFRIGISLLAKNTGYHSITELVGWSTPPDCDVPQTRSNRLNESLFRQWSGAVGERSTAARDNGYE